MNRKKVFLYVSAGLAWVFILMCTFLQDHSNVSPWGDYMESEELALEGVATIQYGQLSSGDTQVTLQYGKYEVEAVLSQNEIIRRALFPAGAKHIGVSFANSDGLDTLVLFDAQQAHVFTNVIAMDSDTGRIATLKQTISGGAELVVSNFYDEPIVRLDLVGHDASFVSNPQIRSAAFSGNSFTLSTDLGIFSI